MDNQNFTRHESQFGCDGDTPVRSERQTVSPTTGLTPVVSDLLTAQQRFDLSVQQEIQRLIRQGEENYARQQRNEFDPSYIESFSQWLDERKDSIEFPGSFEEWLKQNNDSIIGV